MCMCPIVNPAEIDGITKITPFSSKILILFNNLVENQRKYIVFLKFCSFYLDYTCKKRWDLNTILINSLTFFLNYLIRSSRLGIKT